MNKWGLDVTSQPRETVSMHTKKTGVISQSTRWPRSFRRRGCAAKPVAEDFEEVGVLMTVPCALWQAQHGTCWTHKNGKELRICFTRPSLSYFQRRLRSWYSQKLRWRWTCVLRSTRQVASLCSSTQLQLRRRILWVWRDWLKSQASILSTPTCWRSTQTVRR